MRRGRKFDRGLRLALARSRNAARRAKGVGTTPKVSPLAPAAGFPELPKVEGLRLATAAAGIRYRGRDDVMLALLPPGSAVAGVTTRSATRSAPVLDCEAKLALPPEPDAPAAILVNAGNANAFTGRHGTETVEAICGALSEAAGVPAARVFTASTGVIGQRLPYERITSVLEDLIERAGKGTMEAASRAIMTTDTFAKGAGTVVELGGQSVSIVGIAKGSGMIAPDMATMLVYVFTDADIEAAVLQPMVGRGTDASFNCITVDSDTSTSDTLIAAATRQRGPALQEGAPETARFEHALSSVMLDLAHQVVRDGEGATKFVEVRVSGAESDADAKRAAMAVANSPLVKTAIAGEDPNWGRIVMAIGKSGAAADRDRLSIRFGDLLVAEAGWVSPEYREEDGAAYMRRAELTIACDLGIGVGTARVWTCDLTHGYVSINADYRS